jgi:hypothetical protein
MPPNFAPYGEQQDPGCQPVQPVRGDELGQLQGTAQPHQRGLRDVSTAWHGRVVYLPPAMATTTRAQVPRRRANATASTSTRSPSPTAPPGRGAPGRARWDGARERHIRSRLLRAAVRRVHRNLHQEARTCQNGNSRPTKAGQSALDRRKVRCPTQHLRSDS